ncbi:hypothetical protein AB4Z38_15245 [Arthrobacter sp. 2RAF6]|uniref:hypothetical protein n=1 Tax=Arthrobacter sp. 2RAF6 TaxID=3233002 RepID=UPI003F8FED28
MRRSELEHAIRAATEIIRQDAVIIIGSQAILASFTEEELPVETTMSDEVDIAPMNDDDTQSLATELDAAIGEMSYFHETHGFYVQGVGQVTAVLPAGWTSRLVKVSNANTLATGPGCAWSPMTFASPSSSLAGRRTACLSEHCWSMTW